MFEAIYNQGINIKMISTSEIKISILIDEKEIELARENGGLTISLGKRILRTETAAITAVGMCMLYAESELNGDKQ